MVVHPARPSAQFADRGGSPELLREQVIDALGVAFACGDLELAELERRLEVAVRSDDAAALHGLIADLPSGAAFDPSSRGGRPLMADPTTVNERGVLAAFAGGTVRKGSWVVPRHLKVVAVMGGVELDLRQARLAPGVTEIEVFAIMGGVEIVVPHGVRVETMGMAVMGGFEASAGDAAVVSPDQPVVRLSGLAIAAGVDATHRKPSAKAMKRFRRAVAQARRAAQR